VIQIPADQCRRNKKILVVTTELDFGGAESGVLYRARVLRTAGYDVCIAGLHKFGRIGKVLETEGFEVHTIGSDPRIQSLRNTIRLTKLVRKLRPDVVHTIGIEANFHGVLAAWFARTKVIVAEEIGIPVSNGRFIRGAAARQISSLIWKRADKILAISTEVKNYLIQHERAPTKKIFTIPYFIDQAFLEGQKIGKWNPRVIGCVGRLSNEKGQMVLLSAFQKVLSVRPNMQLWLVGDGPDRPELETFCRDNGLTNSIKFLGARLDIVEILKDIDIFVLPSLTEGFGIALLEALAMRVPAIASRVGGVPEIVSHNVHGFLVPAGDPNSLANELDRVMSLSQSEIDSVTAAARDRVEQVYSPRAIIGMFDKLYS
jgi:glycosyltransferase involved in cell wall biosynthesis